MNDSDVVIVGLGDAGCQIVDQINSAGVGNAVIAVVNTDSKSLANSKAAVKLQIGANHTDGLGAGGDVELGRRAAEDDMAMIGGLFSNAKLVFLIAGLGGGTGTGAAPAVLAAAASVGAVTLCFVTLPFKFEGRQRRTQADSAVVKLTEAGNTLIVIPNDRLAESVGLANAAETFEKADRVIGEGICSIEQALVRPGLINLNFSDLRKVIKDSGGVCTFGYGAGKGKNKAREAIGALLENSLLERGNVIANAGSMLVSIAGGYDLTLKEINDIMDAVSRKMAKDNDIIMGTVVDDVWHDRVVVTVVAADRWTPVLSDGAARVDAAVESVESDLPKRHRQGQTQTKLALESSGKGRFKDLEPTVQDGEDMDIPTFMRRGLVMDK